jgi:hypothetical protein
MKAVLYAAMLLLLAPVSLADYQGIKVLALSPSDNRAVIKDSSGQTKVVTPGESVEEGTVLQVLAEKLVLQDPNGEMVWLLKSKKHQTSEVKRFAGALPKDQYPTKHKMNVEQ